MPKSRILVVDDNKLSLRMVEERLIHSGYRVSTAASGPEALEMVQSGRVRPDLVISDVLMPGMHGYDLCRELRHLAATQYTPIVLLTSKGGVQEKISGFRAGADDYLVKPIEPAELEIRIQSLLARTAELKSAKRSGTHEGKVISVFSLRGGAGVSTIAVNVAVALRQLWQVDVALIDMALVSGHVAMMLDLKSKDDLVGLAEYLRNGELDEALLDRFLVAHGSGLHVLTGLRRPEFIDLIPAALAPTLVPYLQEKHEYIVVDTDSSFSDHNLELFDVSDTIVLVVNPELASVQASSSALDVFESLDYPDEKMAIVLNHTFPSGGLYEDSVEKALRMPIQAVIPYQEGLFVEAINRGVPPVWKQPNAPAPLALQHLAYWISTSKHRDSQPQNPSETWYRVQSRLQRRVSPVTRR